MEFLEGITPRKYQEQILETCINNNCLVVLPTGMGKTLIALMLTIQRMKSFPGEKVLFLAPTKPLAEQQMNSFRENLTELFGDIQLFTGEVTPGERKKIWKTADIIFSTPQCIANDIKNGLYDLSEVCLLIQDEVHRCVKNYDYNYIAQKYKAQSTNQRLLGLTASPGSEASRIKEICNNLSIEAVELRTRESPDVKPYLQELSIEKQIVELPEEFVKMRSALTKLFQGYIDELKNRRVLWTQPSKTELIRLQKRLILSISKGNKNFNNLLAMSACAQAIKVQHALELLETQTLASLNKYLRELFRKAAKKESKGVVRLVSKPEFNYVFIKCNELLTQKAEHPKIPKLIEIIESERNKNPELKVIVFSQFRDTAKTISKNLDQIKGIKTKVFVGQAKKQTSEGISGLSQKEQKKMIQEFSTKKVNVLCATSIGEEGLDIPEVNIVILYEPVPSAIRAIQRAGRTARLMEGKLIMLLAKGTRDEAYFYVSKHKEKKMREAIRTIKEKLSGKSLKDIQKKLQ
jgi:Fanconi anemia group M protein